MDLLKELQARCSAYLEEKESLDDFRRWLADVVRTVNQQPKASQDLVWTVDLALAAFGSGRLSLPELRREFQKIVTGKGGPVTVALVPFEHGTLLSIPEPNDLDLDLWVQADPRGMASGRYGWGVPAWGNPLKVGYAAWPFAQQSLVFYTVSTEPEVRLSQLVREETKTDPPYSLELTA